MTRSRFSSLAAVFALGLLAGCGEQAETQAVCSYTAELESSLVATQFMLDSIATVPARQMQSTVGVVTETLKTLREIAPSGIRDEVGKIERAYQELSVSLANVYWDGTIAINDRGAQNATANLARNDNVSALQVIRNFLSQECLVDLSSGVNALPSDDQSILSPSLVVEPQEDVITGFDNEDTALRAYGYVIAEQNGASVTDEQAFCIGNILFPQAQNENLIDESNYQVALAQAFASCDVIVN